VRAECLQLSYAVNTFMIDIGHEDLREFGHAQLLDNLLGSISGRNLAFARSVTIELSRYGMRTGVSYTAEACLALQEWQCKCGSRLPLKVSANCDYKSHKSFNVTIDLQCLKASCTAAVKKLEGVTVK